MYLNNEWKPNAKQALFLALPAIGPNAVKEALYGGGNGCGKSDVLLMYPVVKNWYQQSGFKQVFLRRTYVELRNEIVPRSRDYYRRLGAKFNASEMVWRFPREDQFGATADKPEGAHIFLAHCEHEDDVHNFDSMEINLFTPDELQTATEWIYLYIGFTRVRTSNPNLPAIIRAGGMPGDIGHTFVKRRFVDPAPKGGKLIIGKAGVTRFYVHATVRDNPILLQNDPSYIRTLEALPEAEKQARLYGSWDAYLGQVFEEFRDRKYPDEPENALHVIEPFDIPDWWPKIIGMDWGFAPPAMTCILYAAISPAGQVIVYREQTWQKTKIEEWCAEAKPYFDKENPKVINLCQSATQNRGQEHTILQQICNGLGRNDIQLSGNQAGSRVAGKMLLHEYLRWKPKFVPEQHKPQFDESRRDYLLRCGSVQDYQRYMAQFEDVKPEGALPKLLIFNTCPKLIQAIKSCSYEKPKDGGKAEDVAEFPGDDPYDAVRYLIDSADRFFTESKNEHERLMEHQKVLDEFNRNKDYNYLFRNSHILDSNKQKSFGVARYHGRRR